MNPAQGKPCRVGVQLGRRSYDILIGSRLLEAPSSWDGIPLGGDAMIVSNETVGPMYLPRLRAALLPKYRRVLDVELPDGEQFKDWATLNHIFDALLHAGCDRKTTIYALGGGVVGDLAGFAAACFMRGVPFVQVPTTLLAQVDSSVGGKTAINHPSGKNMIGAFYQPLRVLCDLDMLATLPARELASGLAEVIKYGPIADWPFLDWVDANLPKLLGRDAAALTFAIRRSCEIKASVVGRDELDHAVRATLNFGHTFGHAIEAGLGYGTWLHGEAVACGMVMAADLSWRMGLVEPDVVALLRELVGRCGLPTKGPAIGADRYLQLMRLDKKAEGGEIRFVLLEGHGRAFVRSAPDTLVREVLASNCATE
jgi:3-dehydroquinate synthase